MSFVSRPVDLLMGHDGTASLVIDKFVRQGGTVWDASKVVIVFDHFAPPATIERANIQNKLIRFAKEHSLPFKLYEGICHQLLLEDARVAPGQLVIGADSHTTTAGAVGAFATGVGATDFLNVLQTGQIWLRVPKTIKVELVGAMPAFLQGKDVVLALLRSLGADGANYRCLEFHDMTDEGISMDNRATICNMAVDLGAKFGLFVPDQITRDYVRQRGGEFLQLQADTNADYESVERIDLSSLEPLLSSPGGKVEAVREHSGVQVTQVFMGSCTAGRLEDLAAIARMLAGRKIYSGIKVIVIPGSQAVFSAALEQGYINAITAAGAVLGNASCGPCCNIDKGVAGDDEVSLSTSNRNYPGRMGSLLSQTYLASSVTAAATALTGRITDPREFL